MNYAHDRVELKRQYRKTELNTRWPVGSTDKPDLDDMRDYLYERGLSHELARGNGWYPSWDAGDDYLRIVIPALSSEVGHAYWQARAINPRAFIRYQSPKGPRHDALVRITPENRTYRPDQRQYHRVAVITEGPMDALAAAQCGVFGYGLMGATPSTIVLDRLVSFLKNEYEYIFVMPDRDAVKEGIDILYRLAVEMMPVKLIRLEQWTDKKDFASLPIATRRTILMGELDAWEKESRRNRSR
mgnify:FL=1